MIVPGATTSPRLFVLDLSMPPTHEDVDSLDRPERDRAERLFRDVDQDRFIVRHALLRTLLAADLDCDPADIVFATGACGQPRVAEPATDIEFSLSSSHRIGLLALGTGPLGVDVEHIRPDLVSAGAAEQFLTAEELTHWSTLRPAEQVDAFFVAWTRKEAAAKACGLGLGGYSPRERAVAFATVPGLATFIPEPGYLAALAVTDR